MKRLVVAVCMVLLAALLLGCGAGARLLQAQTASAIAHGANGALPVLVSRYDAEGREVIRQAQTEAEARAGLDDVKARWQPIWLAWAELQTAQDFWASALEQGGDWQAALVALRQAYCALRRAWPEAVPAMPLAPVRCPKEVADDRAQ